MARAALRDTASETWSAPLAIQADTTPTFGFGAVFYADSGGSFNAAGFQGGESVWSTGEYGAVESPVLVGNVLYLANYGQLAAVSPVTGTDLWEPVTINDGLSSLTAPVLGTGYVDGLGPTQVLYLNDAQNVYLVPLGGKKRGPPAPRVVWTAPQGVELGPWLLYAPDTQQVVVTTSEGLVLLQAELTSTEMWSTSRAVALGGYPTAPTPFAGTVLAGTARQTLAIVGLSGASILAESASLGTIEQPVTIDGVGGTAYVPTDSGTVFLLDPRTANRVEDTITVGGRVSAPLVLADGLLYAGCADRNLYCFELADLGGSGTTFEADSEIAYVAGVSSGTAYFGTDETMHSVAFADLIHDFNSQSQLIVDLVEPDQPRQIPAFQTQVTLYDPEACVRPFESVKVFATSAATLLTDNQQFAIDASSPATFQTDATGTFVLSVPASTSVQADLPGGLSAPALLLWASFMDVDERILIYPDQRLHERLQRITGTDLQNATTFPAQPGQATSPLLPEGFQPPQGNANASALAQAINNIVSLRARSIPAGTSRRTRGPRSEPPRASAPPGRPDPVRSPASPPGRSSRTVEPASARSRSRRRRSR
jgi:outer membrane protein assembly factor BamB